MNTFAITDIHGRFDLLRRALDGITRITKKANVIFLGDYIDRGPDSARVLKTLMHGPTRDGDVWTCLKGNHEDMMVHAVAKPRDIPYWTRNGGETTLKSYNGEI